MLKVKIASVYFWHLTAVNVFQTLCAVLIMSL